MGGKEIQAAHHMANTERLILMGTVESRENLFETVINFKGKLKDFLKEFWLVIYGISYCVRIGKGFFLVEPSVYFSHYICGPALEMVIQSFFHLR